MSDSFSYNLASFLKSSPHPYELKSTNPMYEGFADTYKTEVEGYSSLHDNEDYISLDHSDYAIYSEKSKDSPYEKYTIISHNSLPLNNINTNMDGVSVNEPILVHNAPKADEPLIKDVIVSKQFEESYMSPMNRIYIGSLTIVGLYVLFRYLKE